MINRLIFGAGRPLDVFASHDGRSAEPASRTWAALDAAALPYVPDLEVVRAGKLGSYVMYGRSPAQDAQRVAARGNPDKDGPDSGPSFEDRAFLAISSRMALNELLQLTLSPATALALQMAYLAGTGSMGERASFPHRCFITRQAPCLELDTDFNHQYSAVWVDKDARILIVGFKAMMTNDKDATNIPAMLLLYSRMKNNQRLQQTFADVDAALRKYVGFTPIFVGYCMGGRKYANRCKDWVCFSSFRAISSTSSSFISFSLQISPWNSLTRTASLP